MESGGMDISDPQTEEQALSLVLAEFSQTLLDLLQSLTTVFPECAATARALHDYQALVFPSEQMRRHFITEWYTKMKSYDETIRQRNLEGLAQAEQEIPVLRDLHLVDKWKDPDFSDESREYLWSYFANLNAYAKIYNEIPGRLIDRIEKVARMCDTGDGTPPQIDCQQMLTTVFQDTTQEELMQLTTNLGSLFSAFASSDAFTAGMGSMGMPGGLDMLQQFLPQPPPRH